MEFPIKCHDVCPDCECADCIGAEIIQELKDEGKIPEEIFQKGLSLNFQLFNQATLPKIISKTLLGKPKVGVLQVIVAVCKDCKRLYVREIDLSWQEIQVQMVQQQGPSRFG